MHRRQPVSEACVGFAEAPVVRELRAVRVLAGDRPQDFQSRRDCSLASHYVNRCADVAAAWSNGWRPGITERLPEMPSGGGA